jgi:AGCS family alanine or glycine:cation symporter
LGKWAFKALDDYNAQRAKGLDPVFVADSIPGIPKTQCWHETREELPTIDSGIAFGNIGE